MKRRKRTTEIIVHCSATPEGKEYTVDDIRQWHKARGFEDIGYHYVVYRDGSYHRGRDVELCGAHCSGHNAISIGICYIGGLAADGTPKDTRTEAQKKTLQTLIRTMRGRYGSWLKVFGHRDFANKACPCFDAKKEYNE